MKKKSKKIIAIVVSVLMLGWWVYSAGTALLGLGSLYVTAHGPTHNIPVQNSLDESVKVAITAPGYFLTEEEREYNLNIVDSGDYITGVSQDRIVDSQISFPVLSYINIDTVSFDLNSNSDVSIFVPTEDDWIPHRGLNLIVVFEDGSAGYKKIKLEYDKEGELVGIFGGGFRREKLVGDFVLNSREDLLPIEDSMKVVAEEIAKDAVPVWVGYLGQFYFLFQIVSLVAAPFLIGWLLLWGFGRR